MELLTYTLVLKTDKFVEEPGTFLRGFIGNKFKDKTILHHHLEKSCLYKYPLISFEKTVKNKGRNIWIKNTIPFEYHEIANKMIK